MDLFARYPQKYISFLYFIWRIYTIFIFFAKIFIQFIQGTLVRPLNQYLIILLENECPKKIEYAGLNDIKHCIYKKILNFVVSNMEIAIGQYLVKMSGGIYKTSKVEVKRATSKNGSEKCVKIIDKQTNEQEQQNIEREQKIVEILKNINHPNIIRYFDVYDQDNKLYIFMEMCDQSLAKHIEKRDYSFSEREIFDFIFQVSSGYLKLIELEIFHRDIKAENIVIKFENDNRPIYKVQQQIIDFGKSNTLDLKGLIQRMQTPIQSSLNTSPESKTGHYDERSDLYSVKLFSIVVGIGGFGDLCHKKSS